MYSQVLGKSSRISLRFQDERMHFDLVMDFAGTPMLSSLQILGDHIEGAVLTIEKEYCGGVEGPSKIQWFLVSSLFTPVLTAAFL
jgi:hypothetical protein